MKILVVVPEVPYPLNTGGKQAQFHVINRMRNDHYFEYVFRVETSHEFEALEQLRFFWPNVRFHPYQSPHSREVTMIRRWERRFRRWRHVFRTLGETPESFRVRKTARRRNQLNNCMPQLEQGWSAHVCRVATEGGYDIIQVEFTENIWFGTKLKSIAPLVFLHHELRTVRLRREYEAAGVENVFAEGQLVQVESRELGALRAFDAIMTLSKEDAEWLRTRMPGAEIVVSPPCGTFAERPFVPWSFNHTFVFVGGEGHYPNLDALLWFVTEIWPVLRSDFKKLQLLVIGNWNQDTRRVLKRVPGLRFLGFVDDLGPILRHSVAIAPIRIGSGVRIKLIDSACFGIPIVSSSIGIEGLGLRVGVEYLKADNRDEWITAVHNLVRNPFLGASLATAAKRACATLFCPEKTIAVRASVYKKLVLSTV